MEENTKQDNNIEDVKEVKVVKRGGCGCFTALLWLILIVCGSAFAYKKIMIDFNGNYATGRLIYSVEYGFCMLITYYPDYQKGDAKGFAVTHIPFEKLFTEEIQANKYGDDAADYGDNMADSKGQLYLYQSLATYADNALIDSLAKIFSASVISTRSVDIGIHGKYFVINYIDYKRIN